MVGDGEILAYNCGSVDLRGDIDVNGVHYCPFNLRARMAVYDGAGVVVIGSGGGVAGWWWCWSGVYEV